MHWIAQRWSQFYKINPHCWGCNNKDHALVGPVTSSLIILLKVCVQGSAVKRSIGSTTGFTITEKSPTSWLKAPTSAFTFKTLLRHYAKQALTPRSLKVKLGPRRNYHKGRAAIRHYANQTARPLWPLRSGPNFTLRDRGVNACLA